MTMRDGCYICEKVQLVKCIRCFTVQYLRKVSFLTGSCLTLMNYEIIGASKNVFSTNLFLQLKHASSCSPPAGLVAAGGPGPGLVRGAECGGLAAGGEQRDACFSWSQE